jgi:hypothetical protein
MHRTTVMLPDDLARVVEVERQRLGISSAELVRHALVEYLKPRTEGRRYSFVGIFESDGSMPAEQLDEYLAKHYADDIYADSFSEPDADRDR